MIINETAAKFPSVGCIIYYSELLTSPRSSTSTYPLPALPPFPCSTSNSYLSECISRHINKSRCTILLGYSLCKQLQTSPNTCSGHGLLLYFSSLGLLFLTVYRSFHHQSSKSTPLKMSPYGLIQLLLFEWFQVSLSAVLSFKISDFDYLSRKSFSSGSKHVLRYKESVTLE